MSLNIKPIAGIVIGVVALAASGAVGVRLYKKHDFKTRIEVVCAGHVISWLKLYGSG